MNYTNGAVMTATRRRQGAAPVQSMGRAASDGRKPASGVTAINPERGQQWLEAERSIWEGARLSEDRRFVLIGNQVTIMKHGRWQGYWGMVRSAKDGRVTVELSSYLADGSVIELPAEHVSYDLGGCSERFELIVRYSRMTVDAKLDKGLTPHLRAAMLHRADLLKQEIDWLGRHQEAHRLSHQAAKVRLGMMSNYITALVLWTGGAK